MTIDELEQRLNGITDKLSFEVKEAKEDKVKLIKSPDKHSVYLVQVHKNEIWVYLKASEDLLFKIIPPTKDISFWHIDLASEIDEWDLPGLEFYIQELELAKQFISEKIKEG